ncbi:alpha/beta hydrolase [soil metagenome]
MKFLIDESGRAKQTVLLAHGAGGPMDSAAMTALARTLAGAGLRFARFEFAYMASRRSAGGRRPPPRAETLCPEYKAAIEALSARGPLIIGGKSMGGRVASMIADNLYAAGRIAGILCIGYPFHPMGKPDQLRTAHLAALKTPALIAQGTRDPFGTAGEVAGYKISKAIDILWLEDGDHDLKPRRRVSGFSAADHLETLGKSVRAWANKITDPGFTAT